MAIRVRLRKSQHEQNPKRTHAVGMPRPWSQFRPVPSPTALNESKQLTPLFQKQQFDPGKHSKTIYFIRDT